MKLLPSNYYCSQDGRRFDILKIVLAIFVVAIHTTTMDFFLRPILRIAVPIFFIMTSYFFFLNQKKMNSYQEKKKALIKFSKRYLLLYLFWFIVLLPITVICRKWYVNFGFETLINVIKCFLFSSTFRASWFLTASLINIVFVWWASRKISDIWLIVLGLLFYFPCCLFSNYNNIVENENVIESYIKYASCFSTPYNSFPVALLFIMFGKILAEKSILFSNRKIIFYLIMSIISLYIEFYIIQYNRLFLFDDCYLSLVPSSLLIFMLIGQNHITISFPTREIRKCSTIIYCCHASIASCVNGVLTIMGGQRMSATIYYGCMFMITLLISFWVYTFIQQLSKSNYSRLVKWAY